MSKKSQSQQSITQKVLQIFTTSKSHFAYSFIKLLIGSFIMYSSYLLFGIIQQKLFNIAYRCRYDQSQDIFKYTTAIVIFPTFICSIVGKLRSKITNQRQSIPLIPQIVSGLFYFIILYCTNQALVYVSFPLQSLFRNYKLLCIIIVGVFFSRVQDSHQLKLGKTKLLVGVIITIGVLIFSKSNKDIKDSNKDSFIGLVLLVISIVFDAFFADYQAYLKKSFNPSANQLFLCTNLYTFVFSFIYSVFTFQFFQILIFIRQHKDILTDLIKLSFLGCCGQMAIYYLVKNFKQHIVPLLSTLRKIGTILLSILIYKHQMNRNQWIGIIIVFSGVMLEAIDEIYCRKKQKLDEQIQINSQQNITDLLQNTPNQILK